MNTKINQLLVSIIVPNYNHAIFLHQRLDSIFNQTYQDFEVIILDDASTDNSLSILNTYKNHVKVSYFIVNTQNSGSPFNNALKGLVLLVAIIFGLQKVMISQMSIFLKKP